MINLTAKELGNLIDDAIDALLESPESEIAINSNGVVVSVSETSSAYEVTVNGDKFVSKGYGWVAQ